MEKGYNEIIKPCPKCGSTDIFINHGSFLCVYCNECNAESKTKDKGTRLERYCAAIHNWNNGILTRRSKD